MSVRLQHFDFFSSLIDREEVKGGSLERPTDIVVNGQEYRNVVSIANAANTLVYNDQLSSFQYLSVASDYNTRALVTDNTGNSFSLWLRGTGTTSKYGIALSLGNDNTSGASARINTIRVFNTSGNTAKVRITVVK